MRAILPKHLRTSRGSPPRSWRFGAGPTLASVPSLTDLVRSHTDLDDEDVAWLQLLQADWQIIADLSFADLVLWLPDQEGKGFWAAGQMRPTTGPTAYVDDVIGTFVPVGRRPLIDAAFRQGRLVREGDPKDRPGAYGPVLRGHPLG